MKLTVDDRVAIAAALIGLFGLAACGGGDEPLDPPQSPPQVNCNPAPPQVRPEACV